MPSRHHQRNPVFLLLLLLFGAVLASTACTEPEDFAAEGDPLPLQAGDIEDQAVRGSIRGEDFAAEDVRFRIERMEGRERLDLIFAEHLMVQCGVPLATEGRRLGVRFDGVTVLDAGELRIEGEDPPFTVHYEVPAEWGFRGFEGGLARLRIETVTPLQIAGSLEISFADKSQSHVQGRFRATPCASELDVDDPVLGAGGLERTPHEP